MREKGPREVNWCGARDLALPAKPALPVKETGLAVPRRTRRLGRAPLVVMLKSADIRKLDDLPKLWALDGSRIRTVHVQRPVDAPTMVVLKVAGQDALDMAVIQYDDVIQALSSDGTDQTLNAMSRIRRL